MRKAIFELSSNIFSARQTFCSM